jgi:hypothetical protein
VKKILLAGAALATLASPALAAAPKMPTDFIGEWCAPTRDGNTANYTLPSWTEDRKCTEILSIDQWNFVFNLGGDKETYCDPKTVRTKRDTAPSGTVYSATVSADCYDGMIANRHTLRTFEFFRYKGNMTIKETR